MPLPSDAPSSSQQYLDPAPVGIDARFAWPHLDVGGTRKPVGFVDLEQGWVLDHRGLAGAAVTLMSGKNQEHFAHGTSVLGIVVARDPMSGTVGVAPHARARVISEWRPTGKYDRADAIMAAVSEMDAGDVLLLETQFWPGDGRLPWPCEARAAVFEAIRQAAALGMVIVEPVGNGSLDLDDCADADGRRVLSRRSADFQDSGAIMVAAACSSLPHVRSAGSSFGSRVDCYAWGDNVATLTSDRSGEAVDRYTVSFGGTSGAAAIVAGAAVIVQSLAEARLGHRFSPAQLRAILSSPANGTASSHPARDRIGVMPDLRKILRNEFGISQDLSLPPQDCSA
jgi:hypothetical protein